MLLAVLLFVFTNVVVVDFCRDFFTHEGGRNTVEFFKETQTGDGLFIALKFESRSIAKDVLNRLPQKLVFASLIYLLLFCHNFQFVSVCIICSSVFSCDKISVCSSFAQSEH